MTDRRTDRCRAKFNKAFVELNPVVWTIHLMSIDLARSHNFLASKYRSEDILATNRVIQIFGALQSEEFKFIFTRKLNFTSNIRLVC